ncbi:hypothetical protein [Lacihabitans sp. CS3-21]|uniref:hypothetical protein n=1 Tax=Lacihabitans sp. CS3-21 TaxID=2487332 RepID=UPI0020CF2D04|nr:hypothetical protein [Lacihabitans sp. CS3-21]MCP9745977.1 hypothetical protein [Lacihabitans sp. CS3-21]
MKIEYQNFGDWYNSNASNNNRILYSLPNNDLENHIVKKDNSLLLLKIILSILLGFIVFQNWIRIKALFSKIMKKIDFPMPPEDEQEALVIDDTPVK